MVDIMNFDEAIRDSVDCKKRNLLLGNGFSIACVPNIFPYESLFKQADFSSLPKVKDVFTALNTQDFEVVIRALQQGSLLMPVYGARTSAAQDMKNDAAELRELLITMIVGKHPDIPGKISDDRYRACRKFLAYFLSPDMQGKVYTLNYDLLLYWSLMHEDNFPHLSLPKIVFNDGFGPDEDNPDAQYVVWKAETSANKQCIYYLHGALHLYDTGTELHKYTWSRRGVPLIEQVKNTMNTDLFPVCVSEGESEDKLKKIRHTAYLQHSLNSFREVMDQNDQALFIYGHSLSSNDDHILTRIVHGKCSKVYVSLYGDSASEDNKLIVSRAKKLEAMRDARYPMTLVFYDASTANVWGGP